jgi:hypothetical protein
MQDFEKLGVFYLGKGYDLRRKATTDELLLYDAKDLTTHAVCVGMTGSGKTGLCLSLLEEAAIDGIPAIAVDPKGDLGNLLLTFPDLKPSDFQPWVDPGDATRQGVSVEQLAEKTATTWRDGLAKWGQEPARIRRFRDAVDLAIYTPGSSAGLPLALLKSFSAPPAEILNNNEALRDRVAGTVSGLLALMGVEADPLRSREHILLSNILDRAWRDGRNLEMANLIHAIQAPPFDKVGVMDLESFFPAKERFELAMSLNNLMASPGFAAWMEGEPLDIQRLLFTPQGKPRLSILSIAHLTDAERMFFVTLLLNELIAWMRVQSGTSSLRALFYMDEVFGYFPPISNPPSKTPMLTLVKQARAFGLGIVLATQNPVDLDYKGLTNAGTWFLGRLQTERDKSRVLEGLEGASAAAGSSFDRQKMEATLAALGNRVFLMNNVHEDEPVLFQTRWALSYLRGPLTRDQIAALMQSRKAAAGGTSTGGSAAPAAATTIAAPAASTSRPVLPPDVVQGFVPRRGKAASGEKMVYRPALLGAAKLHFAQTKLGVDEWDDATLVVGVDETLADDVWSQESLAFDEPPELESEPEEGIAFAPLPAELTRPKKYAALATALKNHLYGNKALTLHQSALLDEVSKPGESEGDFRVRVAQAARELRDAAVDDLRAKYQPKLATINEQLRKAEQRVEKEKSQASSSMMQAAIQFGASVFGALMGRKFKSAANVQRAATSARAAGRVARERGDVGQAEENVDALRERLAALEAQCEQEVQNIQSQFDPDKLKLEAVEVQPKKSDISVTKVMLAWVPYRVSDDGRAEPLV